MQPQKLLKIIALILQADFIQVQRQDVIHKINGNVDEHVKNNQLMTSIIS